MPHKDPEKAREYAREYARKRRQNAGVKEREQLSGREYYAANRERLTAYRREWYARNLEKSREQGRNYARKWRAKQTPEHLWALSLWSRHRMQPFQWQAMYDEQDGKCYLCLRPLPDDCASDGRTQIAIDHDHRHCPEDTSCAICRRGLACMSCNRAIGLLGEDPAILRVIADNLEREQAAAGTRIASAPFQDSLF